MTNSQTALIIVDMQKGMASPAAGHRNNPQAEANIARLLTKWRACRAPVVHVRHLSRTPGSLFWPGQPGAEFQDALRPAADEHVVEKNIPDAFAQSGLEKWLRVRQISALVIVGVSTNNSVESTARSAGNLGFQTTVIADACYAYDMTDYDGVLRDAKIVHAMALANLRSDYAQIATTEELLAAT
jgi:nicotinamidase-related amidase